MTTLATRLSLLAALTAGVCLNAAAQAQPALTLGPLFQDHAVFQRDAAIPIWGAAAPGDEVTLTFAGVRAAARADVSGRWTATLPPVAAGGPHTLTVVAASGSTLTRVDLLVGDVFLCSGQSNMEFGLGQSRGGEPAVARAANDQIRVLTIPHAAAARPAAGFETTPAWQPAAPASVRRFSAVCYLFGREIHAERRVPVGLINASWAGSAIEPWIAEGGLRALGGFDARLDLLATFVADEAAANQRYGRLWEDWWRGHGATAGEPWLPGDTGSWLPIPGLRSWKTWGVPELTHHDGMVWYRRVVTLTPGQAASAATLKLGGIDEVDQTWVNGRVIRNTFGWGSPRSYPLPPGTLREGENTIVVNVLSTWDAGGLLGPPDAMSLAFDDGTMVPLGEAWTYRAVPLGMGRAPRAPWESVSGLTTLYNGMIAPIGAYRLRAVLWYQGESNGDEPAGYEGLLGSLMASWRAQFGTALPFLVVQLPSFGPRPATPVDANWASVREAQRRAVAADAHAGLVVTIDIGEPGDLHPLDKREVSLRLARAARHVVYGEAAAPSGPVPEAARRAASGIVVQFGAVEGSLVTYSADVAIGFEVCGAAAGTCRFVAGRVEGTRVVLPVAAAARRAATRVRFCWGASPVCNLSDASGLPAVPCELPVR